MRGRCVYSVLICAILSLSSAVTHPAAAARATSACTLGAAGDVAGADDWKTGAESTARLIERERPTGVLALGDLAYNFGTKEEFTRYYDPTWGRFKEITHPTPGNHEYYTAALGARGHDATAYFDYFGVPKQYSFDVCGWHVVSLNSEVNAAKQAEFLREDVAHHPGVPLLLFWHTPRFSSGRHGDNPGQQTLWAAANDVGAKLVLVGHDHIYERHAPMNANGERDDAGVREFVAGGGGHHSTKARPARSGHSEKVVEGLGVLFLDLRPSSYSWRYLNTAGETRDEGTATF